MIALFAHGSFLFQLTKVSLSNLKIVMDLCIGSPLSRYSYSKKNLCSFAKVSINSFGDLNFTENFMQQSVFIIDAFFHRNHGLCTAYPFNIIDLIDNIFGVCGVSSPYFTKYIKLSGSYMGDSDIWNFSNSLHDKLCLGSFINKDSNIGYK